MREALSSVGLAGRPRIVAERGRLDLAICNAGIVESAPFLEVRQETWARHLDVDLTGVFNSAQAAARAMVAGGTPGRIVLTGSWVGDVPWLEIAPYCVSKAGVKMLGRAMAKELAPHGIRVNVMAPGIVRAGMARRQWDSEPRYRERASRAIPLRELQSPESVAEAMLWLCSPASDYMTGTVLLVDGGASLFAQE
jgi:NAD(P)-dependent dehydrogenase (short-subunit alcohol dehydrogenase family)